MEISENENMTAQNPCDEAKAIAKGKYKTVEERKKSQINNLNLHLKELEKEQQIKSKTSRTIKINIRVKINHITFKIKRKKQNRQMKQGAASLKRLIQFIKLQTHIPKRENTQINEITTKREEKNNQHQRNRIIREYYERLYAKKFDNLEEMDKLLETYELTKLKQTEMKTQRAE